MDRRMTRSTDRREEQISSPAKGYIAGLGRLNSEFEKETYSQYAVIGGFEKAFPGFCRWCEWLNWWFQTLLTPTIQRYRLRQLPEITSSLAPLRWKPNVWGRSEAEVALWVGPDYGLSTRLCFPPRSHLRNEIQKLVKRFESSVLLLQ